MSSRWGSGSSMVERVQAGMTFVDGLGIGDVGGEVLRDRRKLAGDGVVVVVVTVDAQTGRARRRPRHREPGLRPRGDLAATSSTRRATAWSPRPGDAPRRT